MICASLLLLGTLIDAPKWFYAINAIIGCIEVYHMFKNF